MEDISQNIEVAKTELFKYFSMRPNVVWKEEDLQSHLYHQLLVCEPKLKKRLHREFPVIISSKPRKWGMLDLAITDESSKHFCLEDVKIDYAIELKFPRSWETGLSPTSLKGFEKESKKDCKKMLSTAINFKEETKKYFWAFRLTKATQIKEIRKIFQKIKWDGIEHNYIECYTNGSECQII